MLKSSARSAIRLRGVRHNNLKNFDLDLPLNQLIVITGLSGSGKSSLAFDTLFAEGQRRYIETFSPYARQFFDRMDKPRVDSIEGIPPAIAIEQRNSVKTTRSTVGTMTEICDYMKMLWPHIAQLHCRQCGQPVRKDSPQQIWEAILTADAIRNAEVVITFELPLSDKLSLEECLALVSRQGYQRLLLNAQVIRLDEMLSRITHHASRVTSLTVIQDRLKAVSSNRARFVEACEQAYHFGKGKLTLWEFRVPASGSQPSPLNPRPFSNRLHCAQCDIEYREPSPALFSFNHPLGACPTCRGFGRVISIDYDLALPDRSKTLAQGVVKPWQTGQGAECQTDLMRMCRHFEIPTNVPFARLPRKWQDFVIDGEPGYGKDEEHEWPQAWYGIKGYFRWLESKAYKMHVRVLLSRYRTYTTCPDCGGQRFQPEGLLYKVQRPESKVQSPGTGQPEVSGGGLTLADFYLLPIRDAVEFVEALARKYEPKPADPLGLVLNEVRSRLGYLSEVGLGYLTLDRPTRSLSGGETERVNLTTCLGTRLVNTLFVLDEPSVGLHSRDTERLISILERLRDTGNTVVVVEHEASVMRAADQIVDLGPGHGATGGEIVFQGRYQEILKSGRSLTGQYLSGRKQVEASSRRPVQQREQCSVQSSRPRRQTPATEALMLNEAMAPYGGFGEQVKFLRVNEATKHNLKNLSVEIPLGRFVCVTGVSGSGKTTLVREVLLPALSARLRSAQQPSVKASERIEGEEQNGDERESQHAGRSEALVEGWEHLGAVVLVDQSVLGKTPRSNPAVYVGAFDDIRELFAQSPQAKQRGLNASAFSFNSSQGQCERCRGAGYEKIEMQFLSDVFIRCPECDGRRFRSHILEIKIRPEDNADSFVRKGNGRGQSRSVISATKVGALSIADLLDSTLEEAIVFLEGFSDSRSARRALRSLKLLEDVGLGYLKLGQPINTLSGGESQRLKLVRHLAEVGERLASTSEEFGSNAGANSRNSRREFESSCDSGVKKSLLMSAATIQRQPGRGVVNKAKPVLFLFDEPTTGLHFEDVRVLLRVFQRLVDAGHSVLVIEHNLDVIKSADWIIDLGPDAGDQGGQLLACGTPQQVMDAPESHTGRALREVLEVEARSV